MNTQLPSFALSNPEVSVLMPVFNAAQYVEAAIASILSQEHSSLELVLLDDGSTDGSTPILRRWAAADARVRLIVQENQGLIRSRNRLLSEARAQFCAWMDADDIAYPHRLSCQLELLRGRPELVAVGSWATRIDPSGAAYAVERHPVLHESIRARQFSTGGGMRFPTVTMRVDMARAVGGFRDPFVMGEDLDLLMRMAERGALLNVAEPLLYYRVHGSSTTATHARRWTSFRDAITSLAMERANGQQDRLQRGLPIEIAPALPPSAMSFMASEGLDRCRQAMQEGRWREAQHLAVSVVRSSPASAEAWRALVRAFLEWPSRR